MTEPLELLKKRYIEIDKCYKSCIENGSDIRSIKIIRLKYKYVIKFLGDFGFKSDKNHIPISHYNATLKKEDVIDIRENCILGVHKKKKFGTSYFAKKYNVSRNSILKIVNRQTHANI